MAMRLKQLYKFISFNLLHAGYHLLVPLEALDVAFRVGYAVKTTEKY